MAGHEPLESELRFFGLESHANYPVNLQISGRHVLMKYRSAQPGDAEECVVVRGKTRQNPASEEMLRSLGITADTWAENIRSGALPGHVCTEDGNIVGFCFGDRETGEIVVLAMLPDFEGRGIGRELLDRTVKGLAKLGYTRLFLGCSPDPESRSHGFYRHLGWRSTETFDQYGDEILELMLD
jgi:GNAT superfamily N-acetyltransferase